MLAVLVLFNTDEGFVDDVVVLRVELDNGVLTVVEVPPSNERIIIKRFQTIFFYKKSNDKMIKLFKG